MNFLGILSAIPKAALFLLLIVGGAIAIEVFYLNKKRGQKNPEVNLPPQTPNSLTTTPPVLETVPLTSIPPTPVASSVIPKKNLPSKKILAAIGILFLVISIPTTVILIRQRQEIRKEAYDGGVCYNLVISKQYSLDAAGQAACESCDNDCITRQVGELKTCNDQGISCQADASVPPCSVAQVDCLDAPYTGGGVGHIVSGQIVSNCLGCSVATTGQCLAIGIFDSNWVAITDLSTLTVGQTVFLTTHGSTTDAAGITMARFRINGGAWQQTTTTHSGSFYIQYVIPNTGAFQVDSMVFNPTQGWF